MNVSTRERIADMTAAVEILPHGLNGAYALTNRVSLHIGGVFIGDFGTYTEACTWALSLINSQDEV